jgi:hypothetical protein
MTTSLPLKTGDHRLELLTLRANPNDPFEREKFGGTCSCRLWKVDRVFATRGEVRTAHSEHLQFEISRGEA